ncbi:MAG: glycosyltransferase [Eubacteriales bacterium]
MKVLFIGCQNIIKTMTGGEQESQKNYKLLNALGEQYDIYAIIFSNDTIKLTNVSVFSKNKTIMDKTISVLSGRRIYRLRDENKVLQKVKEIDPNVIFLDTTVIGGLIERINAKIEKKIKVVTFMHNVEVNYVRNQFKYHSKLFGLTINATYNNEKKALDNSDKIIVINQRDERELKKVYNKSADLVLPVSFADTFQSDRLNRSKGDKKLLFVGSDFPPNYHGIKRFVEEVMCKLPEYELTIVGRGFENRREELSRDNVEVVGSVDDLSDYYYNYSSVVMPIFYGDGMKVKTAEAMMYGMNILATDEALEGYDVDDIEGIKRCNTVEAFVEDIRKLEKNGVFNNDVRNYFLNNHEMYNQLDEFRSLIESD